LKVRGQALLKEEIIQKKSFKAVEDILEFKRKSEELIQRVFIEKENQDFVKSGIKEAFEYFLNMNPNETAEYLAKFLDFHLKKSSG
jgi:type IV secretory pathway ATPase VirB11/archaellum biosynthesis ATPase